MGVVLTGSWHASFLRALKPFQRKSINKHFELVGSYRHSEFATTASPSPIPVSKRKFNTGHPPSEDTHTCVSSPLCTSTFTEGTNATAKTLKPRLPQLFHSRNSDVFLLTVLALAVQIDASTAFYNCQGSIFLSLSETRPLDTYERHDSEYPQTRPCISSKMYCKIASRPPRQHLWPQDPLHLL